MGESSLDHLIDAASSQKYWENIDATAGGMLGGVPAVQGFSLVSKIDFQGSRTFLARLGIGIRSGRKSVKTALEGGAGIGRVTEGLLLNVAEHVDVIEPVSKFTKTLEGKSGVRNIYNVGLEGWRLPTDVKYDLIWMQWCLGYLGDKQLTEFLRLCKAGLEPETGVIVIKENVSTSGKDLFDETDNSITREDDKFKQLFKEAGLKLIRTDVQRGFPEVPPRRLFPVIMYALKPEKIH